MQGDADARKRVSAYAAFISRYDWDWWCHLTFAGNPTRDGAYGDVGKWLNYINRQTFGNNYVNRGQGVRWVRAAEHHLTGTYHFHLLIAGCDALHTNVGVARWKKQSGIAKIVVWDAAKRMNAAIYISKRVDGGELDFGGPWPRLDLAEISQLNAMR